MQEHTYFHYLISPIRQDLQPQLNMLVKEKLKKYEVHFYPQKNDMLDTEFNFARLWSRTI